ncbi:MULTISPECIES: hypothetical protein [Actinosynnema]|uniref:Phage tail protein n=1 Tax=Actinosynnema pretiosum TaxID=42197 RepID=A0A290ZAX6_9PSEU|nr:hypothetical protein [Actinosynnema pretiosum]ATE56145.1 hypothetical protein CNX65_25080 [Actinosynnema pretiosum]MCP2098594.1 hypothetical protein [Actinosynnema pretiosum]
MSQANAAQAVLWVDGDAWRGPGGAVIPADVFGNSPTTGDTTPAAMSAFGGVKAGFNITPTQDVKSYDVWNNESGGPFFEHEGQTTTRIRFRVSQYSKAAILTKLRGGSITETTAGAGQWRWNRGTEGDEFSLLLQLRGPGGRKMAFWIERAKLSQDPEEIKNDDDLDGWEFEITCLAPSIESEAVVPLSNWNPLAA